MTGVTKNPYTPMFFNNSTQRCPLPPSRGLPYCDITHAINWDALIGMFENAAATNVSSVTRSQTNKIIVAPNPSHDRFNVNFINSNNRINKVPMHVTNTFGQGIIQSGT
jgi:hypothetical protein